MSTTLNELIELVELWAEDKKILEQCTKEKQALKTLEEAGELAMAVSKNDIAETMDGIGDVFVTIIIQAKMNNLSIEKCLLAAYTEIVNRTGTIKNGTFVKD
jgi:NTP pyrophosphatase (non-canonical NTP hydrolase)